MEFLKNALKEVGDNFKKEFNKAQMEQKEKLKKEKTFKATKRIGNLIAFDNVNKMFMTPCDLRKKIYEYSQILDFELLEDSESITQGGLGKALVGGALFGGVGAVVGGVTGKRKNKVF